MKHIRNDIYIYRLRNTCNLKIKLKKKNNIEIVLRIDFFWISIHLIHCIILILYGFNEVEFLYNDYNTYHFKVNA